MRVLVGCECSGRVRDAFRALGHDAHSCDLKIDETRSNFHYRGDVRNILDDGWDLGIFHPDCTYLTVSSAWAYKDPDYKRYPGVGYHQRVTSCTLTGKARRTAREQALGFITMLLHCKIPKVAIENPVGVISTRIRKPDQMIHPHMFGDDASKGTCLWLRGLPKLVATLNVPPRRVDGKPRWANQTDSGQNRLSPSPERKAERARTYKGIAAAMAAQWGGTVNGLV